MKDSNKKLIITILNIVIMVANAVIAYLTKDNTISSGVALGSMALVASNCVLMG